MKNYIFIVLSAVFLLLHLAGFSRVDLQANYSSFAIACILLSLVFSVIGLVVASQKLLKGVILILFSIVAYLTVKIVLLEFVAS